MKRIAKVCVGGGVDVAFRRGPFAESIDCCLPTRERCPCENSKQYDLCCLTLLFQGCNSVLDPDGLCASAERTGRRFLSHKIKTMSNKLISIY